jgi:hypothetical protein
MAMDKQADKEKGKVWIKGELFPRLKVEYQEELRITDHYGWKTLQSDPLRYTFYFEVEGLSDVQLLDIPSDMLGDSAHQHNMDDRTSVEILFRRKLESVRKGGVEPIA